MKMKKSQTTAQCSVLILGLLILFMGISSFTNAQKIVPDEYTVPIDKLISVDEQDYVISYEVVANKKVVKIEFTELKEDYNLKDRTNEEFKEPKDLLTINKMKYYGDVNLKLMHYINITTNESYSCKCRNETTEYPANETNKTEAYNVTNWVCDICYKDVINEVFKEIDPETFVLKNNEPIYEMLDSVTKFEKTDNGWGYAVWTDVNIMGVEIEGATWWNATFEKKQEIQIDNNDLEVANYSLLLNVTYDSDMSNAFEDLRFANGSENELLSYWIEDKVDGLYADVWVKIPYVLTNTTNTSIYMYYDNDSEVSSESDGPTAFLWFYDFNTENFVTDWTLVGKVGAGVTYSYIDGGTGKILKGVGSGDKRTNYKYTYSDMGIANGNYMCDYRLKIDTATSPDDWTERMLILQRSSTAMANTGPIDGSIMYMGSACSTEYYSTGISTDEYNVYGVIVTPTNLIVYYNYDAVIDLTRNEVCQYHDYYSEYDNVLLNHYFRGIYGYGESYIDWVRVRTYLSTTPTYSFGAEEVSSDSISPTVSWDYPDDDSYNNSRTFNVAFTPHDETQLDNCTLRDNRSGSMTDTVTNTSVLIDNSVNTIAENFTADGHYNISIKCWDTSSNFAETVGRVIKVDTIAPASISISSPSNNSIVDSPTITGTWTDTNKDTCYTNETAYAGTSNTFSFTNTSVLTNQRYDILITCNDSANNTGSVMVYFIQDNTLPTITVLYPADDTYNNSWTFNVAFIPTDDFDFVNCTLRDNRSSAMADTVLNTSTVQNATENIIAETFTSDGHYNISVKCENTRSQTVETVGFLIKVDTIKPTITISSPENITYDTNTIDLNWSVSEILSSSSYSLNDGNNQLFFDFTNIDNIDDGGNAWDIWGDNTYIYLANSVGGLRAYTFDGSTFTNAGNIDDGGNAYGVWGDDTYIYLANYDDGLRAYTFDGSTFTNVGNINDGGNAFEIWGDNTYIYLANYNGGLRAYTFDGSTFTNVGNINDGGNAYGVWGDDTYIYLANSGGGLRAYTFDGSTFTNAGNINDGGNALGVWGDDTYIYLANDNGGLRAYTFDGSTFTNVGNINDGGNAYGVWGDDTYIYLANSGGGLRAYTFNGSTFTNVDSINNYGDAYDVWGDDTYIYLANSVGGLYAYSTDLQNIIASEGSNNVIIYASDSAGNTNQSNYVYFTVDTISPSVSNLNWQTTSGSSSDALNYNQVLDWVKVTATDTTLQNVTITITKPDDTILVDNVTMTIDAGDVYVYNNDITLSANGTWTITVYANDTFGRISSNTETIEVTIQEIATAEGYFGYDTLEIPNSAEIADLINTYDFSLIGVHDNFSNIDTNWTAIKNAINDTKEVNARIFLKHYFDGDYSDNTYIQDVIDDINSKYVELKDSPYYDGTLFIVISLNDTNSESLQTDFTNNISEHIVNATNNKFVVYVQTLDNVSLDAAYVRTWNMNYNTYTNNATFINDETLFLRENTSTTRIYHTLSDAYKSTVQQYNKNILQLMRGSPVGTAALSDNTVAEVNTYIHDVIAFNNQSSPTDYIINVSSADRDNKVVWDYSIHRLLERNTDGNFSVTVPAYFASMLLFEDLNHITYSDTTSILYTEDTSEQTYANYTTDPAGSLSSWCYVSTIHDVKFEIWDGSYLHNNTYFHTYGWLNATQITDWSGYDYIIISDTNIGELDYLELQYSDIRTNMFGYINVAGFTDTDEWENDVKLEAWNWTDVYGINVFIDGLDAGVLGSGFETRLKRITDSIRVDKNKKVILNDYTSYQDVSNYGDIDMKESWCGRWDDAVNNPTYSYETLSVDKNRAIWARTNPHPQLAMTFGDVNDVEKMSYCYAMYLVLLGNSNNNSYRYAQPNFQTQREIRVKQVGSQLESTWTETSSTDWNRKFTNGVMHINPIEHTWWFDDGRTIESAQLCFELYNGAGTPQSNPGIDVRINNHTAEYRITYDMIAGGSNYVWDWVCINVTDTNHLNDLKHGRWNVYTFVHDRSEPNSLVVIRNEKSNGTGIHSWYDQSSNNTEITGIDEMNPYSSWQAYGRSVTNNDTEVINWHTSLNIKSTSKVSVDTFTTNNLITRTESTSKGATTVTYDSLYDYNITVWDNGTYVDKFLSLSVLNGANYERIYPENTITCDSENPTWNTTTVAGDDWGSCYETIDDKIYVRVAIPHLSVQTYQIDSDETPTLTWLYPNDDTYNLSRSFDIAFIPSDDYGFVNCTLRDNRSGIMANTVLNTSVILNDTTNKIAETFTVDGHYNISVKCEDNASQTVETTGYLIKVDTTKPIITISSPENITYDTNTIDLNWSADETLDWVVYSLNGASNTSFYSYCYQETSNVSTACGGVDTGTYLATETSIYVNYTIPNSASTTSLWYTMYGYKTDNSYNRVNHSIADCMISGLFQGRLISESQYTSTASCWNGTAWDELGSNYRAGGGGSGAQLKTSLVLYDGIWNGFGCVNYFYDCCNLCNFGGCLFEEAMWWNISQNVTLTGLSEGQHNITVYANDSAGNMNQSSYVYFTVDTIPPTIDIESPENITYNTNEIWFNVTLDENTDTCLYSLNNANNVTMTNDTLLHFYHQNTSMTSGSHTVMFYCNDSVGNMNSTEIAFYITEIQYVFDAYENNLSWLDNYNTVNISCINISSNVTANYTFGNMSMSDVNTSSIKVYDNASNEVSYDFVSPRYLNFNVTAIDSPYTIQYTRKDLKKLTVAESSMSCPVLYSNNGPYCRMTTSTSDRVYYYYRFFWNVTTNDTVSTEINANYTTSTFTNFAQRATNPGISMNGNSADTSHTTLDNKVQIKVGTAHDSGLYSLSQDEYYIDFNYYVFTANLPPEGGTGGGGGSSQEEEDTRYKLSVCGDGICAWDEDYLNCSEDCIYDRNDFKINESISYNLISGITHKQEIKVRNLGNKTIKLLIETQCEEGYEEMCDWQWFMFNDVQSKDTVIELVPFGENTFTLYTLPPLSANEITYTIHLKLTRYDTNKDDTMTNIKFTRVDQTVMISSIFETFFDYVIDIWEYEFSSDWEKPIPLTDKDNITTGDIVIFSLISIAGLLIVNKYSTTVVAIFKS